MLVQDRPNGRRPKPPHSNSRPSSQTEQQELLPTSTRLSKPKDLNFSTWVRDNLYRVIIIFILITTPSLPFSSSEMALSVGTPLPCSASSPPNHRPSIFSFPKFGGIQSIPLLINPPRLLALNRRSGSWSQSLITPLIRLEN